MKIVLIASTVALVLAGTATAQVSVIGGSIPLATASVSGGVSLWNENTLDDLYVQTPPSEGPVVQGWASVPLGESLCSVELFGTHGLQSSVGAEVDLGAKCSVALDDKTTADVVVSRYLLHGMPDMTELTLSVSHGPVDAAVSRYFWDRNPDATQVQIGYSADLTERFSTRLSATYETGFGAPDILVGGVEGSYALRDNLSLNAIVRVPLYRGAGDDRDTRVMVGVEYTF